MAIAYFSKRDAEFIRYARINADNFHFGLSTCAAKPAGKISVVNARASAMAAYIPKRKYWIF